MIFPKLYIVREETRTPSWQIKGDFLAQKPPLQEVLKYAKGNIVRFINQYAADLPVEHKEEIEQTVYVRLIQAYEGLDADAGWKSYVFNHCRGGVLDYVKFGKGFEETKWSIQKEEEDGSKNISKIKSRVTETKSTQEDEIESIDEILGKFGVSGKNPDRSIQINWSLVAHMAAQDPIIHAFAKYLLGFSVDAISAIFGICRSRASQLITTFVDRLDDPQLVDDVWTNQTIFAFGLCKTLGVPEVDQSEIHGFPIGWGSRRIDLYSNDPFISDAQKQMSLFDAG